jgi:alkanesulfonate monooxygenase SsuD/methylene tetrahydromethanopterin reductase-like flavin-dependent oxidoreductase (luciferase family)
VRFSINIPNFGDFADARTVAKVAVAAEQAGWDAVFVWDHVIGGTSPSGTGTIRSANLRRIEQGPPRL